VNPATPADEGSSAPVEDEIEIQGDVRPALTPAQLAFLALVAAVILTALRRVRRRRT
jgi:hypothetical protein